MEAGALIDDPRRIYWTQVAKNLTQFKQKVASDVLLGRGAGLTGHQRYSLYPVVATCPPGRPRKKYGGKNTQGGFPDPVTMEDALKSANPEAFKARQRSADGAKYFCDLSPSSLPAPCVIFSMGSEGDFSFEEAVLSSTACKVYTFDCTYAGRSIHAERHVYKEWCLGKSSKYDMPLQSNSNKARAPEYKSWTSALQELKIANVDALKIDIEGFEWSTLDTWQREDNLPSQLAIELHFAEPGRPSQRDSTWAEMSMMFLHLANLGYASISRDDNFHGNCCSEFTFIRRPSFVGGRRVSVGL